MLVRTRLLDRLHARWVVPVTVVTAPAGYGKTTLLAQAVAANEAAPMGIDCWVTCTPDSAIASSLAQRICRAVGASDVSVDIPSFFGGTHDTGIAEITTAVAEAMWRRSPQQVALIIDDAHEIPPGSAAAQLLGAVVTSLPGNGHVVLAGRGDSPVPLTRLDVEGRVARMDQAELMFTRGRDGRLRPAPRGVSRPGRQSGRLAGDGRTVRRRPVELSR